ncbi:hypothetical protein [Alkalimarinus coralli]|uniref:hypothetical protein n=1 Tax=Alkalimarinus coralli TaxID=2935863 RepID=UPI00202B7E47|nr:hypothetical protein [Alkalimarinus coralli]
MKPGYIIKHWLKMDFVFPHWTLYWLFWFSLVMIPVPISFADYSGPISYRTGLFLGTYFTLITFFLAMLASYIGYKYTQSKGRTVPDYQNKRYRVMGAMLGTENHKSPPSPRHPEVYSRGLTLNKGDGLCNFTAESIFIATIALYR